MDKARIKFDYNLIPDYRDLAPREISMMWAALCNTVTSKEALDVGAWFTAFYMQEEVEQTGEFNIPWLVSLAYEAGRMKQKFAGKHYERASGSTAHRPAPGHDRKGRR